MVENQTIEKYLRERANVFLVDLESTSSSAKNTRACGYSQGVQMMPMQSMVKGVLPYGVQMPSMG